MGKFVTSACVKSIGALGIFGGIRDVGMRVTSFEKVHVGSIITFRRNWR